MGVPWWSPDAPPLKALAPKRYGPFLCYDCFDHRYYGQTIGAVFRVSVPCPSCNPAGQKVPA